MLNLAGPRDDVIDVARRAGDASEQVVMMADFLPRRDADLCAWAASFARRLAEGGEALLVSPAQAARLADAAATFAEWNARAGCAATDSRATTEAKRTARADVVRLIRPVVKRVRVAARGTTACSASWACAR